jgi:hypothetical protein
VRRVRLVSGLVCVVISAVAFGTARWYSTRGGKTNTLLDLLPQKSRGRALYVLATVALIFGVAAIIAPPD